MPADTPSGSCKKRQTGRLNYFLEGMTMKVRMSAVAMVAALIPSQRAAKTDPLLALRSE